MSQPAISVAMSVYNCSAYLGQAIESILAQTFTDFEFLILNDGSTDDSAAVIDAYAAKDSRIRPIHRENKGLIVSLNQLVAEAKAPLVARMDGDDIAMPERFARQIAFLSANPGYGVLGTWTADIDEDGNPFRVAGPDHPTTNDEFQAIISTRSALCHPSVMMRRELVLAVGGYHAAFKHCEDYDLWLRLAHLTKIRSLPERLVKYRHSDGQVSSRHIVTQQYGTVVSRLAYEARVAGKPDPTENLADLPPLEELDALFSLPGASRAARARLVAGLLYSPVAMKGSGFDLLLDHVREGGSRKGLWRTVARIAVRMQEPQRALTLARALLKATG
jgi:GT2 family glycosyltransferase